MKLAFVVKLFDADVFRVARDNERMARELVTYWPCFKLHLLVRLLQGDTPVEALATLKGNKTKQNKKTNKQTNKQKQKTKKKDEIYYKHAWSTPLIETTKLRGSYPCCH